jgi:hypothetical protein
MFRSAAGSAGDAAGRAGGASAGRAGGASAGSSIPEGVSTGRPGGASAGSSKPEGVSTGPPDLRQALLAVITSRLVFTAWRSVRSGDDPALSMTYSCGSTMDNSRAFRHELLLRVTRAKRGTEPFRPLCNTTNDLLICVQCGALAPKMKHCSGCKWARYCHRECQKANWLTHRNECCPDRSLPAGIRTITYPIYDHRLVRSFRKEITSSSPRSAPSVMGEDVKAWLRLGKR